MAQERDPGGFYPKQLLYRRFGIGKKSMEREIFLKSNVLAVVAATPGSFIFFGPIAATVGIGKQRNFFELTTAIMANNANTHRRKHVGEYQERETYFKNRTLQNDVNFCLQIYSSYLFKIS